MRTLVRLLALLVLLVVAVSGGGLAWLLLARPRVAPPSAETVAATPERLGRGAYLVRHVVGCIGCHSESHDDRFSCPTRAGTEGQGGYPFDERLGVPGVVRAQNITPDPETGIGRWTDGELMRAVREGVSRDGRALFPMMPYPHLRHLADEDLRAVVAFVRTLAPRRNAIPPTQLAFPVGLLVRLAPRPVAGPVPGPPPGDAVARGRYLATVGGCIDCHTPRDGRGRPLEGRELEGGWEMRGPWGRVVTANLTPHPSTWVGSHSREEFVGRFKAFAALTAETAPVPPPGRNTVMPWIAYSGMTEEDLGAIYDFLRTVPPVERRVESFPDAR